MLTRRTVLAATAGAASFAMPHPADAETKVAVYYDAECGCCSSWVAHMEAQGFQPRAFELAAEQLQMLKRQVGVPDALASCHTAVIGRYVVEGHVPAEDVRRLLASGRDAIGLTAPGMPAGAPGMEVGYRERYDVLLILRDGTTEVFARH